MNFKALPYLAAVSATIAILGTVWVLDRSEQQRFHEQRRIDTLNQVSTARARLEGALNSRLFLTEGLVAHVSTHPEINSQEFQTLARVLAAKQTGIRIIELAKNTVISHIYPPQNEMALGLNLLEKIQEKDAIARAIKTRSTVVAGPVRWNDGYEGFISHTPIFITPKDGEPKSGPYWGLATIIINKHTLLVEAGLEFVKEEEPEKGSFNSPMLSVPQSPVTNLKYALRGRDGLGVEGAVFYGEAAIFEQNPILLDVSLPKGSWQLAAIPTEGWPQKSPSSGWLRLGGGALALVAGVLVFVLVQAPARSREAVEQATAALLLANEQLQAILAAVPGMVSWISSDLRYLGVNRHLATACKLSPEDFPGQEIGFINGKNEFTDLVRQFFASSSRETICELTTTDGSTRSYLVVAQKYDRDRAAFAVGIDITERKIAEEHLRASEAELKALFAAMTDIITVHDGNGRCLKIASNNPSVPYKLSDNILGRTLHDVLDRETADSLLGCIHQALELQETVQFDYTLSVNGEDIWLAATVSPILNDSVLLVARDVSKYKRTEEALRQAEEKYRSIFENAVEGIFQSLPNGRYISANPALARIYGYNDATELIENFSANVQLYLDPNRRNKFITLMQLYDKVSNFESQVYRSDGQPIWVSESVRAVRDPHGELLYYEGIVEDITDRKRVEEQLLHNAFHDALTGLPNRLMFMERVNLAIKRSQTNSEYRFAVLFLDLDRFKVINDSLGHPAGDKLLIAFAQRLERALPAIQQQYNNDQKFLKNNANNGTGIASFTIARLGGDEFTILLEGIKDVSNTTLVAERIQQELTLPFNLNGQEIFTTASIGIVMNWEVGNTDWNKELENIDNIETETPSLPFKSPTIYQGISNLSSIPRSPFPIRHSAEDWLRDADIAMYKAKAMGKATHAIFDGAMYANAVVRLQLENELRRAISAQEFEVYYQPIICLENGKISGFEALVRWQNPRRGLVSPSSFIALAEETGLIIPLGTWVLREAARQMRNWQLQFNCNPPMTISVNLSGQQFSQPDLIDQFQEILQETGLDGSSLKLEITETVITEGSGKATTILKRLRDLNIQLCIDDFGTGYSSLSRLHHFPINTLKIDRSFVSRMGKHGPDTGNHGHGEIVQTIVMLAHNLGMDAIAEGVETAEQLAQLKLHNCEYGQGYFFSRPLTSVDATALLAAQN
jgi:PAS domain S-box-containing protein